MTAHRSFTPEFKAQVVLEVLTGVRSASERVSTTSSSLISSPGGRRSFWKGMPRSSPRKARPIPPWRGWQNWSVWWGV